jgi:hypothetical protein
VSDVLIALADVGPGVQLEEQLTRAGLRARWDAATADGPRGHLAPTVVILDADHLGPRLAAVAEAWRELPSVPGVVAVGSIAQAREHAPAARITLLASTASIATVVAAIKDAAKLRLASGLKWTVMRAAVGLPPIAESTAAWAQTLTAARTVDLEIPRAALRWHATHYATPTAKLDQLREERILIVPEVATSNHLDGTTTVATLLRKGPLDPLQSARLLWALASLGAIDLTPEVRDQATPARRALAEVRHHLRARATRLERSTFYDVLELTPLAELADLEDAYRRVAARFAPAAIAGLDLAELAATVQPMWDLVDKARAVLVDHPARGRYHDWLRARLPELRTTWAIDVVVARTAAEAFTRGQRALGEGDVHRAMSELATACRQHPGHPEYEANLAWARYRVQVAAGKDRADAARNERILVEDVLAGCRVWPRALVALALLCAAGGDADAARWYLTSALAVDPNLPAAVQLLQRLGVRR